MSAILVVTPSHRCSAPLAIAAARAGETGILDLGFTQDDQSRREQIDLLTKLAGKGNRWGLRWNAFFAPSRGPASLRAILGDRDCPGLVLAGVRADRAELARLLEESRQVAVRVLVEVTSARGARLANELGFDGIILKGNEAAGLVSRHSIFTLLSQVEGQLSIPYWAQGGMGPDTAAAAFLAGASGVVLREQTWLAQESPFDHDSREMWGRLDGAQSRFVGDDVEGYRAYSAAGDWTQGGDLDWQSHVRRRLIDNDREPSDLLALGRDIAMAQSLAQSQVNVAGIIRLYHERVRECLGVASRLRTLSQDSLGAKMLGVSLPMIQVLEAGSSDETAWIERVREGGALPALRWPGRSKREPDELARLAVALQEKSWGIVIDEEERAQSQRHQQAALDAGVPVVIAPSSAIEVGPDSARQPMSQYALVTSASSLSLLLDAGVTRFAIDGWASSQPARDRAVGAVEDGGAALWQIAIDRIEEACEESSQEYRVLVRMPDLGTEESESLDGIAAAMAAVSFARLGESGVKLGLLHSSVPSHLKSSSTWYRDCAQRASAIVDRGARTPLPWLADDVPAEARRSKESIAIVGMACMFPKAPDLRSYWMNICQGVDAITLVPPSRWRWEDFFSEDRFAQDKVYSKWGGFLDGAVFDPVRWRIPPASLQSIEPIQLLSLEVAWRAMRDAGYDRREFPRERSGVIFATAGSHDLGSGYAFRTMMRHYLPKVKSLGSEERGRIMAGLEEQLPDWTEDSFPGFLLNVVAGRIARELNLNGPNYVVDAACAASLAALHAAIEQLRSRTSDMMLVGAADATNNPFCYMSFAKTHALSPRGKSRPFDDSGDGIALGEGIACVILKRLDDAERDGDKIYAVIKGIGSSSDGKNRSLTAPHPPGQMKAVVRAYDDANISPATVSLVEAHGTGTVVGDSAEITTLNQVFSSYSQDKQFSAVGSVKSMIGHTKTVAGLASLIKTALALKHEVLPPTIGVENPSKRIDFANSPFYVNTQTRPWLNEQPRTPLRAGVSAFGFGGTNFHVVMEEYQGSYHPGFDVDLNPRPAEVFLWSRATKSELLAELESIEERWKTVPKASLAALASAIHQEERRRDVGGARCRLAMVASTGDDLLVKLSRARSMLADKSEFADPTGVYYSEAAPVPAESVCFLYPGQGSQSVNMLADLVTGSRWSHSLFSQVNARLAQWLKRPLSRLIYPPPALNDSERQRQFAELSETRIAQPALGVVELFATDLLARHGIRPGMVAGHSYGEHVALHVAGCFSRDDLIEMSARRGEVCADEAEQNPGGMIAVASDARATQSAIDQAGLDLHIANKNAPDQTIIAGSEEAVEAGLVELAKRGLRVKRIPVSAPFHTSLLARGSVRMAEHFAAIDFAAPSLPVYSNTTGKKHGDDPSVIRELLTRHFSEPVHFEDEVRQLIADGARVFIEAGPGKVLIDLVQRISKDPQIRTVALDVRGRDGWTQFGHLLGQCWSLGLPIDLQPWFDGRGLEAANVSEFFEQALAQSKPKPSDWIVSPSRAEPVTPLPARKSDAFAGLRAKFGMKDSPSATSSTSAMSASHSNGANPDPSALAEPSITHGAITHGSSDVVASNTQSVPTTAPEFVAGVSSPEIAAGLPTPLDSTLSVAPRSDPATPGIQPAIAQSVGQSIPIAQAVGQAHATASALGQPHAVAGQNGLIGSVGPLTNGSRPATPVAPSAPRLTLFTEVNRESHVLSSQRTTLPMSTASYQPTTSAPLHPAGLELFAHLQATMRGFLEYQTQQQRTLERFLEMQERTLLTCMGGGVAAMPMIAAPVASAAPVLAAPTHGVALAHEVSSAPPAAMPSAPSVASPRPIPARPPVAMPSAPSAAPPPVVVPVPSSHVPAPATPAVAATPAAPAVKAVVPAPVASAAQSIKSAAPPAPAASITPTSSAPASDPVAKSAGGPPTTEAFRQDLLAIVSERTGYPTDMLDEDLPLEAGLGIDSIKTVEIFSNLKEYHAYFGDEDQDEEEALTQFTNLKTLKDIITSYDNKRSEWLAKHGSATAKASSSPAGGVERYSVTAVEAPMEANGSKKNFLSAASSSS